MNKKRKETEKLILEHIDFITGGSKKNKELYEYMFKNMSDEQFDNWMKDLRDGKTYLQIVVPNDKDSNDCKISVEGNLTKARKYNYNFFQSLIFKNVENMPDYKTPEKYLILDLPFRRTKQTSEKGVSVSANLKQIDMLTGQVKDNSQATRLSYPEVQILVGMGLKDSAMELMKDRGGDVSATRVLVNSLMKTGRATRALISLYSEGVVSSKTLQAYFTGMHLKANIK